MPVAFAVLVIAHSSSIPFFWNITVPAYSLHMQPRAHKWYTCSDNDEVARGAATWLTPLTYRNSKDPFLSRMAECVKGISEPALLILMDDWVPVAPVDYSFLSHAAAIVTTDPAVAFVALNTVSSLEFGGIASYYPGLLFSAACLLQPSVWNTKALRSVMHQMMSAKSVDWRRSSHNLPNAFERALFTYRSRSGRVDARSFMRFPGLKAAPLSEGSVAFPHVHLTNGGKWSLGQPLCELFGAIPNGWRIAEQLPFHPDESSCVEPAIRSPTGWKLSSLTGPTSVRRVCERCCAGKAKVLPPQLWRCRLATPRQTLALIDAARSIGMEFLADRSQEHPPGCRPVWGRKGAIHISSPLATTHPAVSSWLDLAPRTIRTNSSRACCFTVDSKWRMDWYGSRYRACVHNPQ